jgi:hypothetical protein
MKIIDNLNSSFSALKTAVKVGQNPDSAMEIHRRSIDETKEFMDKLQGGLVDKLHKSVAARNTANIVAEEIGAPANASAIATWEGWDNMTTTLINVLKIIDPTKKFDKNGKVLEAQRA